MATPRPRPQVMTLTDAAATRIRDVMAKSANPIAGLRVGIKNAGCAGMSYTMEYAPDVGPHVVRVSTPRDVRNECVR